MDGVRKALKKVFGEARMSRLRRWWLARTTAYPDWKAMLDPARWQAARAAARGGPKILIATNVGAYLPGTTMESLLAVALTLRGADVHVLLCDEALPACFESGIRWHADPSRVDAGALTSALCSTCYAPAAAMYRGLGLTVHTFGQHLTDAVKADAEREAATLPIAELSTRKLDGMAVGEHALAGALRFYARGDLTGESRGEAVLRQYYRASVLAARATASLLAHQKFDAAVFHHGIYVPQGLTGEAARKAGVRVINWNPAYRKKSFIFSHGDTYHHTLMTEPTDRWDAMPWTEKMETRILDYLKSRWQGTQDWIWFHEKPQEDVREIARELGVDFSKPTIGLLTNVVWDAQLHYPANAFANMLDWILKTIAYFAKRPQLQLLIRVHPAEIRGTVPSRHRVVDEVRKAFSQLPPNVFVIPPESPSSTYAAMGPCNAVIIYGTKTGVELSSQGMPVIVAGEAWIRNKGLTMDASSEADYYRILDGLPLAGRMPPEQITRARKYAYHFFFRRMIPVEGMEPASGWPPYVLGNVGLDDLMPGRNPGLDVICDGILTGSEFVFPAERADSGGAGAAVVR